MEYQKNEVCLKSRKSHHTHMCVKHVCSSFAEVMGRVVREEKQYDLLIIVNQ